jgi:hypothetical protein
LIRYRPGEAPFATAKLPVTVPTEEIVHVVDGLLAKSAVVPEDIRLQLRELPVAKPPPATVIAFGSGTPLPVAVPYPGGALAGVTNMLGPEILLNWAVALLPWLERTVTL